MIDLSKPKPLFTDQELKDIESWREPEPTKFICSWMFKFRERVIKSQQEPDKNIKKAKMPCFCGKADRLSMKTEFFIFWDDYKNNSQ